MCWIAAAVPPARLVSWKLALIAVLLERRLQLETAGGREAAEVPVSLGEQLLGFGALAGADQGLDIRTNSSSDCPTRTSAYQCAQSKCVRGPRVQPGLSLFICSIREPGSR